MTESGTRLTANSRISRAAFFGALALLCAGVLVGVIARGNSGSFFGDAPGAKNGGRLVFRFAFGSRGHGPGEFSAPRGIAVNAKGHVYVVDRSGRVQAFDSDGEYRREWRMPETQRGTPTGMGFDADGNLLVADTHYSRMIRYAPDGRELARWGTFGTGAKERDKFTYLTDVAGAPGGGLFVVEYGQPAHHRLLRFEAGGRLSGAWGSMGSAPGKFRRPMGVAVSAGEVYVADALGGRIQVFGRDGAYSRSIGDSGSRRLKYPYDVSIGPRGVVYVVEYAGHRLRAYTAGGALLAEAGGYGSAGARLNYPWGVAAGPGGNVYVADTKNHRVAVFRLRD